MYGNRGMPPFNVSKSKSKNKHRNTASGQFAMSSKMDGKSKQQLNRPMMTTNLDSTLKMEIGACDSRSGSSINKYDSSGRSMHVKEEPISDTEVRNDSESDTDSDTEKKKSNKKSAHDKSGSKKSVKGQKSRKSTDKTGMDGCLLHENPTISDDNSNDSSHNFVAVKSEAYQRVNVKNEIIGGSNNDGGNQQHQQQRDDGDGGEGGQSANAPTNLDKSSSSVDEFDNEKPSRVIKVSINLDYDSEVYNDEVNIRRFHKYQRNMEIENTLQVTSFDSSNIITAPVQTPLPAPAGSAGNNASNMPINEQFPYESNIPASMLDCSMQLQLQQQQHMAFSSSDSESDDSDANDLDDSDNSSCDECAVGPCSTSVLPPLQNGSPASSPAMSMSSYYTKNGKLN